MMECYYSSPPPGFSYRTIYYSIERSTSCNLSFHSTRPQLQRYLQLSCQVGLAHACSDPVNHQHFEQDARSSIRWIEINLTITTKLLSFIGHTLLGDLETNF